MRKVQERSAGAVVFHEGKEGRRYLLLRHGQGHWGFPKGHLEGGETDVEAAAREITEETGIPPGSQRFLEGFTEETAYSFWRGRTQVDKDVAFFLCEVTNDDVRISHEHTEFVWLPYEEAVARVTFEAPKDLIRQAEAFLKATRNGALLADRRASGGRGGPASPTRGEGGG